MAVFGGVWRRAGRSGRTAVPELLSSLHAPFHTVLSAYDDDGLLLVAKALRQPAVVSRGGVVAALSGRPDPDLQPADILDEYRDSSGGLENLSGDYALAVFDAARATLILMRDPVGTQPLYYSLAADCVAFGSQITAVLAGAELPARPNHSSIARLLLSDSGMARGQTCFLDVHTVAPGYALVVDRETVSNVPFGELRPIVPTPLRTFDESAAAFRRAFRTAVERRVSRDRNTAVLVSGGVDSAAILCTAAAAGQREKILAISYGTCDGTLADERAHVEAVVATSRVRSVRLSLAPIGFTEYVDANVRASEVPICDDVPGTLHRAAAEAREDGADHLMIGTWGDQVMFPFPPPHMLHLLRHGHLQQYVRYASTIADWLADVPRHETRRALMKQAVRGLVPPRLLGRLRRREREIAAVLDRLHAPMAMRRHEPTSYSAALRRELSSGASVDAMEGTTKWGWAHGLEAQLPFLDADMLQLLLAIPSEHTIHEGVPKALLRKAMAGMVPERVLQRRDKGDYTQAIENGFAADEGGCLSRLEGGRRLVKHGFMSQASADRTLAPARARGEIGMGMLPTLVGLDAWLRIFIEPAAGANA